MKKSVINLFGALAIVALSTVSGPTAFAATYYWDNNGGTAGFGTAGGTWAAPTTGSSSQGWSTDSTGATLPGSVTTATTDALNFGNGATGLAAGTVTVSGSVSSGDMTFASGSGGIIISGGTAIGLASPSTITINNGNGATINTAITSGALTLAGANRLHLNGANTYSGATIIGSSAAVEIDTQSSADANSDYTLNGTLEAYSNGGTPFNMTIGALNGSGNVYCTRGTGSTGSATLTVGSTGASGVFSGAINNNVWGPAVTHGVTKVGAGTQTLSGANTYTGPTTISLGTLQIGNGGTSGSLSTSSAITDNGVLAFNRTDSIAQGTAFSGAAITGSGALTQAGSGTLTLNAANAFTGNVVINAGTIAVGSGIAGTDSAHISSNLGDIGSGQSRTITINNGGNLTFTGGNVFGYDTATLSTVSLVVNQGGVFQTGPTSGSGYFSKIGPVTLNGGTISVGNGDSGYHGALALLGTVTVGGSTPSTIGILSGASTYDVVNIGQSNPGISSGTFNVADVTGDSGVDLTVSAGLANQANAGAASSITKTGAGTMVLSGNNTFTGSLSLNAVSGSTVILSGNNTAKTGTTLVYSTAGGSTGATLQLQANGGNTSGGVCTALGSASNTGLSVGINGTSSSQSSGATIQLRSDSSVTFAGGNNMGGLGGATFTIDVNQLTAGNNNNVLTFAPGGISIANTVINVTGGNGYSLTMGNISDVAYTTGITLNPTTANVTVTNIVNNGNPVTLTGSGNSTVAGVISGTGGLTKSGSGTATLLGANSYTGDTAITGGTLALGTGGSLSSTNIIISSGTKFDVSAITYTMAANQALRGFGNVNGSVTLNNSTSFIKSGSVASVGTNTFNNNLTMTSGGATFRLSTSASSGNDQIMVTNTVATLTIGSGDTIHISALSGAANLDTVVTNYVLFSVSGTTTMSTTPLLAWDGTQPANYLSYAIKKVGQNVVLQYTAATAPTVTATSSPATVARGQAITVTATVTPGSPGSVTNVQINASAIGGSSAAALVLSATANVYTNTFIVASSTALGVLTMPVVAMDNTPLTSPAYNVTNTVVATNEVWNGAGGDNKWSTGANWVSGYQPGAGDSATLAGTTRLTNNLDSSLSLGSLTFSNTAGSFNITNAVNTLTLTAGLTNNSANTQTVDVPVVLSGAQTLNAASGNVTISRAVSDTGSAGLTKAGSGTLTLSGVNTYSGATTIGGGALTLGGSGQLGSGSYSAAITDNGSLNLNSSANQTLSGSISGTGALTNSGSGTLTLSGGSSTFGGGTTLSAGQITLGAGSTGYGNSVTSGPLGTNTVTMSGGTLQLNAKELAARSKSGLDD